MLANYSDIDYIMNLDCLTGARLIVKAREREEEQKQWKLYCSIYPHFTEESFIPFDEFYNKKKIVRSGKAKEEIFDEVDKMRKKHGWL